MAPEEDNTSNTRITRNRRRVTRSTCEPSTDERQQLSPLDSEVVNMIEIIENNKLSPHNDHSPSAVHSPDEEKEYELMYVEEEVVNDIAHEIIIKESTDDEKSGKEDSENEVLVAVEEDSQESEEYMLVEVTDDIPNEIMIVGSEEILESISEVSTLNTTGVEPNINRMTKKKGTATRRSRRGIENMTSSESNSEHDESIDDKSNSKDDVKILRNSRKSIGISKTRKVKAVVENSVVELDNQNLNEEENQLKPDFTSRRGTENTTSSESNSEQDDSMDNKISSVDDAKNIKNLRKSIAISKTRRGKVFIEGSVFETDNQNMNEEENPIITYSTGTMNKNHVEKMDVEEIVATNPAEEIISNIDRHDSIEGQKPITALKPIEADIENSVSKPEEIKPVRKSERKSKKTEKALNLSEELRSKSLKNESDKRVRKGRKRADEKVEAGIVIEETDTVSTIVQNKIESVEVKNDHIIEITNESDDSKNDDITLRTPISETIEIIESKNIIAAIKDENLEIVKESDKSIYNTEEIKDKISEKGNELVDSKVISGEIKDIDVVVKRGRRNVKSKDSKSVLECQKLNLRSQKPKSVSENEISIHDLNSTNHTLSNVTEVIQAPDNITKMEVEDTYSDQIQAVDENNINKVEDVENTTKVCNEEENIKDIESILIVKDLNEGVTETIADEQVTVLMCDEPPVDSFNNLTNLPSIVDENSNKNNIESIDSHLESLSIDVKDTIEIKSEAKDLNSVIDSVVSTSVTEKEIVKKEKEINKRETRAIRKSGRKSKRMEIEELEKSSIPILEEKLNEIKIVENKMAPEVKVETSKMESVDKKELVEEVIIQKINEKMEVISESSITSSIESLVHQSQTTSTSSGYESQTSECTPFESTVSEIKSTGEISEDASVLSQTFEIIKIDNEKISEITESESNEIPDAKKIVEDIPTVDINEEIDSSSSENQSSSSDIPVESTSSEIQITLPPNIPNTILSPEMHTTSLITEKLDSSSSEIESGSAIKTIAELLPAEKPATPPTNSVSRNVYAEAFAGLSSEARSHIYEALMRTKTDKNLSDSPKVEQTLSKSYSKSKIKSDDDSDRDQTVKTIRFDPIKNIFVTEEVSSKKSKKSSKKDQESSSKESKKKKSKSTKEQEKIDKEKEKEKKDKERQEDVRRSSRIQTISQTKKRSHGHGLVRDRDRFLNPGGGIDMDCSYNSNEGI